MYETHYELMRRDPGLVVKLFLLGERGELIIPFSGGQSFDTPLLHSKIFSASAECWGTGFRAWRFGYRAVPASTRVVLTLCRIPPGSEAIISPWAVRTESLVIERIRLRSYGLSAERLEKIRGLWGTHCDIELVRPGPYTGAEDLPRLCLARPGKTIMAYAGYLQMRGRLRIMALDATQHILAVHRWDGISRTRCGSRARQRAGNVLRRLYDGGDEDIRDVLTPWMRYFGYIHA